MTTPEVSKSADGQGTATVFIGCRIPNGLRLEVGKPGDRDHVSIDLKGPSALDSLNGVGITEVPEAKWKRWYEAKGGKMNPELRNVMVNQDLPFIKNLQVFECKSATDATAMAIELVHEKTGFEGLDPKRPGPGLAIMEGTEKQLQSTLASNDGRQLRPAALRRVAV